MDSSIARRLNHSLEPLVAHAYFAPEPNDEFRGIGVKRWPTGYFASRGWALGRCSSEVIYACFYNFTHDVATFGIPDCWDIASPEEIGAARDRGVTAALERLTAGADLPDMDRVTELLRIAVDACPGFGRPLFAATAAAPWPDDPPLLRVWHGANKLREFRGDGHIIALMAENVDPIDALVIYAAMRGSHRELLLHSRQWPEGEWDAAAEKLDKRGIVKDGQLTDIGMQMREGIEQLTDDLAMAPWRALGENRAEELRRAVFAISTTICARDGVHPLLREKLESLG
jgi:hypothetical protein